MSMNIRETKQTLYKVISTMLQIAERIFPHGEVWEIDTYEWFVFKVSAVLEVSENLEELLKNLMEWQGYINAKANEVIKGVA